jgi:hypothetical protein
LKHYKQNCCSPFCHDVCNIHEYGTLCWYLQAEGNQFKHL